MRRATGEGAGGWKGEGVKAEEGGPLSTETGEMQAGGEGGKAGGGSEMLAAGAGGVQAHGGEQGWGEMGNTRRVAEPLAAGSKVQVST